MDIDCLVGMAQSYMQMAEASANTQTTLTVAVQMAAIAQAAALTAQAMIMREATITGTDYGQTIRWLRVDAGN